MSVASEGTLGIAAGHLVLGIGVELPNYARLVTGAGHDHV
jgi:hypothetical protein